MKNLFFILSLFIVITSKTFAQKPTLYQMATITTGTAIQNTQQRTVWINLHKTIPIQGVHIYATNNSNTQFNVTVIASSKSQEMPVLKVDNQFYSITGYSGNSKEPLKHYSFVTNAPTARQLSQALQIPLQQRQHPQHQLQGIFKTTKNIYQVGEKIDLTMVVKNQGKEAITFNLGGMYRNRFNRCEYFHFEIFKDGQKLVNLGDGDSNFGGIEQRPALQPSNSTHLQTVLNKWNSFDKPGIYTIKCRYDLRLEKPRLAKNKQDYLKYAHETWDDSLQGEITIKVVE